MRLLLVEDEPTLAAQIRGALSSSEFAVDLVGDGEDACLLGGTEPYDGVVLDLGLPKLDGLAVLRHWRQHGIKMPVLVLTARADWHSKVEGLNAGADDYLGKPFIMEELVARMRALIRRSMGFTASVIACGPISLDAAAGRVLVDGSPVTLTGREFRLLDYLMHRQGHIVSQRELAEHIYDLEDERESNTIEVFIGRIRRKLGVDVIKTIRGLGYRLEGT
ncbi:response regulator transcription factor [Nitrospirillum iridis]|uniref:Two-component system OmpR family response regulator n=1 Tax=Nitrospirillum iridis TaxID=765888 RepID=A0A7X0AXU4_9PROT|nr:response regulator transcription factor [Nitrospirillum iridis]MBB6251095.1 two-component system OmpR family response regulator [Nitrospirillum iridis]